MALEEIELDLSEEDVPADIESLIDESSLGSLNWA